jgi:GrpB-like predicted nucleotidyltransferase (UPF0157 family)
MPQFMKAGDAVWIVPYDPTWPQQFQLLARPVRQALGHVATRIDHIGSTSVAHLAAKPIIDIQISVTDFEPLDGYRPPLEQLGYLFRADNPDRTPRYFRETPGQPRVHGHIRRAGSFGEQFALLFRDYLRAHEDIAATFATLKIDLARRYQRVEEWPLYTEAKGPFIWETMAHADGWAQLTGWFPGPSDV